MVSESDLHRRMLQYLLPPMFGPQVTAVAVHLVQVQSSTSLKEAEVSKGISLQALVSHSHFSVKVVKEALLLLIHHNLVAFRAVKKDDDSMHVLYGMSMLSVLMRMAVPRVLSYVADRFSEAHASLAKEIFLKGRVEATSIGNKSILDDLLDASVLSPVKDLLQTSSPSKRAKQEKWFYLDYAPLAQHLYRIAHFERRLQDRDLLVVLDKALRAAMNNDFSAVTLKVSGSHLRTLSQCMPWLVKQDYGTDAYSVSVKKLRSQLLFQTMYAYTVSRYSLSSARLLAILQAHTLCEERTLAKYAMMPVKECRERLYQLLQAGIVRLQEVPRSADHAPSRTIFLWTLVGEPPIIKLHLHAIVNVAERAVYERQKHALLLTKLARPDVQAAPNELLTETELAQNELMQRVQGRLLIQLDRILGEYCCCLS